jgi:adenylyltransferase/sulfurtransferase
MTAMDRFERQKRLPGFGEEAQQKLQCARVLVVGAGGLGCPALLYLAAAGVGHLGVVDGDIVSISNLNRQIIFGWNDVGKPKATIACKFLVSHYPDVTVTGWPDFLTTHNALEIIRDYDVVLDGSDNFPTRYLVNDACVLLNKPLVLAAIYQYEGQLSVLNRATGKERAANYRDVYPVPPVAGQVPSCKEAGVLGALPGIIGSMQAAECVRLITDLGKPRSGRMLYYNLLSQSLYRATIMADDGTQHDRPKTAEAFRRHDYAGACAAVKEISWSEAFAMENETKGVCTFVDVRHPGEHPQPGGFVYQQLPLTNLIPAKDRLQAADVIFLFCQSGIRSAEAAVRLSHIFPNKQVFTLRGGIHALPIDSSKPL